jgi:16S rRNA (uracil1498-N3)-methyltransferase
VYRFFIDKENIVDNNILITLEDAKHINVLRHKVGDTIYLCDKEGMDYKVLITDIKKNEVTTTIIKKYPSISEPKTKVTIFQSLPKNDKMELIIQKCVELGVHQIVPVITENTTVKLNDKTCKKIERWQKISETAAKQCGRGIIPNINNCITFKEAVNLIKKMDKAFIAYENETNNTMKNAFNKNFGNNVAIFIGAEGGFSNKEVQVCINNNIEAISLGKRILRTETAGFTALSVMLFSKDEL